MAALNRILPNFARSLSKLDSLIASLELNTGSAHKPFSYDSNVNTTKPSSEPAVLKTEEPAATKDKPVPVKNEKPKPKEAAANNQKKPQEKKPQEKKPQEEEEQKSNVGGDGDGKAPKDLLEIYTQVDIRVGRIVDCWNHPESEKLYCEKIDIGDEVREIASGLRNFVSIGDMSGLVIVMANLKPKKLANFNSNGMILCASNSDHTKVELLRPHPDSKVGERVTLEGFDKITQKKEPVLNPKKKVAETVIPHLHTDEKLNACFDGKRMLTSAGYIIAQTLSNCHVS